MGPFNNSQNKGDKFEKKPLNVQQMHICFVGFLSLNIHWIELRHQFAFNILNVSFSTIQVKIFENISFVIEYKCLKKEYLQCLKSVLIFGC